MSCCIICCGSVCPLSASSLASWSSFLNSGPGVNPAFISWVPFIAFAILVCPLYCWSNSCWACFAHWGWVLASCWLFLPAASASVNQISWLGLAGFSRRASRRIAAGVRSIWSGFCLSRWLWIIMWLAIRLVVCCVVSFGVFSRFRAVCAISAPVLSCPMAFCWVSHTGFLPMSCSRAASSSVVWSCWLRFCLWAMMAAASMVCRVCSRACPSGWCSGFCGVFCRLVSSGSMWCRVLVCIPARSPMDGVWVVRIFCSSSYILSADSSPMRWAFCCRVIAVWGSMVAFRVAAKRRARRILSGSSGNVCWFTARMVFVCRSCMPL